MMRVAVGGGVIWQSERSQAPTSAIAIAILKRSLAVPFGITTARLRMDPTWTPLRKDPRFQALLKQTP